jgi:phosphonoacetate hydrolase
MSDHPKFIVCVFDGLRRDMITVEAMPNLRRFMDEGADFPMSRSVFPTATRVNAVALGHGATPDRTGMISNKCFDARIFEDRLFDTSAINDFHAANAAYEGRFINAVSLGEAAHAAGFKTAVIGSGSAGTTRWVNPMAEPLGHIGLCLRDWSSSVPKSYADDILSRFGPIPPATTPNIERQILQTDMLLDAVLPENDPDIAIVWYTDPDATYHPHGIGSPESWVALANTDEQFGRILEWRDTSAERDRVQLITLSDHSHLSATRKIDLKGEMAAAGFAMGDSFEEGFDYVGAKGYGGVVSVRDNDARRIRDLVTWLAAQPWCGMIFTAGGDGTEGSVPGTLDRALLMIEHPRAPDVYFMMRTNNDENLHGFSGGTCFDAKYNEGGAVHGGLHPKEINNVMAAGGSAFNAAYRSALPAGIVDIAPTILHLLGCDRPQSMTGRVLAEALTDATIAPDGYETTEHAAGVSPRRHMLRRWQVGDTEYIDQGWLE